MRDQTYKATLVYTVLTNPALNNFSISQAIDGEVYEYALGLPSRWLSEHMRIIMTLLQ
jgi:hypothetical protein